MTRRAEANILPYSHVVGQEELKRALELAYIAPGIGGVLISGQRGTAKSTAVRAFSNMVYGALPVTLPINATDDRVLGGWQLDALMRGETKEQVGLLEEANDKGLLYIDEVNLLDDYIVNIILDVTSTGILTIQREGIDEMKPISFSLVGTMNPEEGGLRPQLIDRFGLMVNVTAELDPTRRREILLVVLRFDEERTKPASDWIDMGRARDQQQLLRLEHARERLYEVDLPTGVAQLCADLAGAFVVAGHRGEVVTALAARALAALDGSIAVEARHVREIAPLALQHRRPDALHPDRADWREDDRRLLDSLVRQATRGRGAEAVGPLG